MAIGVMNSWLLNRYMRHIDKVNSEFLEVGKAEIPIARAYREDFFANLKIG